jgi:hypothetical protein
VSRFYGIVIAMYYNEQNPPDFHARYGREQAAIEIQSLRMLTGRLAPRALGLVVEWASQHQTELVENWHLLRSDKSPRKIEPLR